MKYFGTDGIRKNAEYFTPEFLYKFVAGLVKYGQEKVGDEFRVMVGGDTRESSEWIIQDICSALESFGVEYSSVGVMPTPAIGYCFYEMGFDFAIDVTASHNPYADNGLKIFERGNEAGEKLCEHGCGVIENVIDSDIKYEEASETLREDLHDETLQVYIEHILDYVGPIDLSGMRIGMDCANGATSIVNKTILEKLGAKVTLINCNAEYGQKINAGCGSTHMEQLVELAKSEHFDMAVAFDGDGDRSLFVDENGEIVDGDQIIVVVAEALGLKNVAATVMANQGLFNWAKKNNVEVEVTPVGDHNLVIAMNRYGIQLGAEQSGHIILPGKNCGDGPLVAAEVAKIIYGKKFSELVSSITKTPQIERNVSADVAQKEKLKSSEDIKKVLLEYGEKIEKKEGRLLVRPSGTENIIRICVWGNDTEDAAHDADELCKKLEELL